MSGITGISSSRSKVIGRTLDTAKVWIDFNGSTLAAPMTGVERSFGVRSVIDQGEGYYRIIFRHSFAEDKYAAVCSCDEDQANPTLKTGDPGAGSIDVEIRLDGARDHVDVSRISLIIFGGF